MHGSVIDSAQSPSTRSVRVNNTEFVIYMYIQQHFDGCFYFISIIPFEVFSSDHAITPTFISVVASAISHHSTAESKKKKTRKEVGTRRQSIFHSWRWQSENIFFFIKPTFPRNHSIWMNPFCNHSACLTLYYPRTYRMATFISSRLFQRMILVLLLLLQRCHCHCHSSVRFVSSINTNERQW